MLSNAYLLAKFRFDTAENERHFAENLPRSGVLAGRSPSVVRPLTPRLLRKCGETSAAGGSREFVHHAPARPGSSKTSVNMRPWLSLSVIAQSFHALFYAAAEKIVIRTASLHDFS